MSQGDSSRLFGLAEIVLSPRTERNVKSWTGAGDGLFAVFDQPADAVRYAVTPSFKGLADPVELGALRWDR